MKVAIAGAGAVGRSIARELLSSAHEVTLFERLAAHRHHRRPRRRLGPGDACELSNLERAQLHLFDVMIAATATTGQPAGQPAR